MRNNIIRLLLFIILLHCIVLVSYITFTKSNSNLYNYRNDNQNIYNDIIVDESIYIY